MNFSYLILKVCETKLLHKSNLKSRKINEDKTKNFQGGHLHNEKKKCLYLLLLTKLSPWDINTQGTPNYVMSYLHRLSI